MLKSKERYILTIEYARKLRSTDKQNSILARLYLEKSEFEQNSTDDLIFMLEEKHKQAPRCFKEDRSFLLEEKS